MSAKRPTAAKRVNPKKTAQSRSAATNDVESTSPPARQPRAMRPVVPPSYRFPRSPKGLLSWTWARDRLSQSHNYIIVTVRPDARPHAMGMHGIWFEDAFYFGTHPDTRKARNLAANPHCIVVNEALDELVIVEGVAEVLSWESLPEGASKASKKKYGWPFDPRLGGHVYRVRPRVVFAFPLKHGVTALTKWTFDE